MLKHALTTLNLLVSCFLWLPSQAKIIRTKRALDYNKWSFVAILYLQIGSFAVAAYDHSSSLMIYFALNGCNVLIMLGLITFYGRSGRKG